MKRIGRTKRIGMWQGKSGVKRISITVHRLRLSMKTLGLRMKAHKLKSDRQELLKSLESLLDITAESQGVAGWHLNGDIAEWGEFEEVSSAYELIKRIEGGE